jgi:hypothetical protein
MPGQDVRFLNARSLIAGNADAMVDQFAQLTAASARQSDANEAVVAG